MASPNTQPVTTDPDRITFQIDRLSTEQPGRLEVRGRWFGVRGRRFFRPTLMLHAGGSEQRLLADLEHKPWAAEDGEEWLAAFPFDTELDQVSELELSVAPDIAVRLEDGDGTTAVAERAPAAPPAPRANADGPAARPSLSERTPEVERLTARLAEAGGLLARERARRAQAAQELEDERAQGLRLRAQIGQLNADLDLARAARQEAHAELEDARQSLQEQRLDSEHRRAAGERRHAQNERLETDNQRLEDEKRELQEETESQAMEIAELRDQARVALRETRLRDALSDQLQAEADRLRDEVARLRALLARAQNETPPAAEGADDEPPTQSHRASEPTVRLRDPSPTAAEAETPPRVRSPVAYERPLNPSLRGRTNWLGRALALLVILAVIAAVVLVIRTTMV